MSLHRTWIRRLANLMPVLLLAWLLGGCAAQKALQDGEALLAGGHTAEGLAKLREAVQLEPTSAQYRISYLRHRDRALQALVTRADEARASRRDDDAQALYAQALALAPGYEPALAALRAMASEQRWRKAIADAEALLDRKEVEAARDKLRPLLLESPRHAAARELMQRIDAALERPAPETVLAASFRRPISIEFKDTALRTVFDILSRTSGLNFVLDKDVRGDLKASIVLRNSTVEAALSMLLLTQQLEQRVIDGSTVLIYPANAAKHREYQTLTVRSFYLAHAEAKQVAATIRAITKTRDMVVDDRLNLLIVRDSPAAVRMVEKLVALHDVQEAEVMLDVEILEVKRTRLLDLGVRLPDSLSLTPLAATSGGGITLRDLRDIDSTRIGATLGSASITAKKQETDANLLANPRIRTRNRDKAKILIGERVPNITTTLTSTGFATDSVTYVDVGLKLDVEPVIYPDGEVMIKIALEVSNIINQVATKSGSVAYQIGTRGAQTVLRLADGENQVLAGLISDEDRRTAYKLPGAGDLPIVGRLFGSQADDASKTEIVLSITPRVLRNIPRPPAALAEFDSGTEASVGARGAAAPLAAPLGPRSPVLVPPAPAPAPRPAADTGAATSTLAGTAVTASTGTNSTTTTVTTIDANVVALTWQAPRQVNVGDTVTAQLLVRSDVLLADLPLTVRYDAPLLQLVSANEGDFMRQSGAASQFVARTEPAGQVALAASKPGGARGSGVLATITFRALSAGIATLSTSVLGGATAAGNALPMQAPLPFTITVTP